MKVTRFERFLADHLSWLVPVAIRRRCGRYWWTDADIARALQRGAEMAEWLRDNATYAANEDHDG